MRNVDKILVGNPVKKKPLGRSTCRVGILKHTEKNSV